MSEYTKKYNNLDIEHIRFDARLDEQGNMPLGSMDEDGKEELTSINRQRAQAIITHLVDVFHIDSTDIQVLYFPNGANHIEVLESKLELLRNLERD